MQKDGENRGLHSSEGGVVDRLFDPEIDSASLARRGVFRRTGCASMTAEPEPQQCSPPGKKSSDFACFGARTMRDG